MTALIQRRAAGDLTGRLDGVLDQGRMANSEAARSTTVDRTLEKDIEGQLDIFGPVHVQGLIDLIHDAPLKERQAALTNTKLHKRLVTRISAGAAATVIATLLEGSQSWVNPPNSDFFKVFVVGSASGPRPSKDSMNCWEAILYAAHLAGVIGTSWIKSFYKKALNTADPNQAIWAQLGWSTALPKYPATEPIAGQLLFYHTGGSIPGHVALSIGNGEAISLWNQPNNNKAVQRIKITDLSGTVFIGKPPW